MAYTNKLATGSQIKNIVRNLLTKFKRVAYTGSYNDLIDKPIIDEMTSAEVLQLVSSLDSVHTIHFDPNEDIIPLKTYATDVTGSMSDITVVAGILNETPTCLYTRDGYSFKN